MRIIAGEQRGARLKTLKGTNTRPTLERVKEGMFSAVHFVLPGAQVLDLYAGSGQLGFEALSRGAAFCTFVEQSRQAADLIDENARALGLGGRCRVWRQEAGAFLAHEQRRYDILLADPPYGDGAFPGFFEAMAGVCAPGAVLLYESAPDAAAPQNAAGLALQKQYRYGTVMVSRYLYTSVSNEEE